MAGVMHHGATEGRFRTFGGLDSLGRQLLPYTEDVLHPPAGLGLPQWLLDLGEIEPYYDEIQRVFQVSKGPFTDTVVAEFGRPLPFVSDEVRLRFSKWAPPYPEKRGRAGRGVRGGRARDGFYSCRLSQWNCRERRSRARAYGVERLRRYILVFRRCFCPVPGNDRDFTAAARLNERVQRGSGERSRPGWALLSRSCRSESGGTHGGKSRAVCSSVWPVYFGANFGAQRSWKQRLN